LTNCEEYEGVDKEGGKVVQMEGIVKKVRKILQYGKAWG